MSCQLCDKNINKNINCDNNNIIKNLLKRGIKNENIYEICNVCSQNDSYINLANLLNKCEINFSYFHFKIFIVDGVPFIKTCNWKEYARINLCKNKEEIRKKEITLALKEHRLENIKPSMCSSHIKFGIPTLETIISVFKKEQNNKEKRLLYLINKLKKHGKEYDMNIPSYEKYINEGGNIKQIIIESDLEKSLVYNTKYANYLKHNDVKTARYLATIEFINSGKNCDIINRFALMTNTLIF
jgi:hypothetical protein